MDNVTLNRKSLVKSFYYSSMTSELNIIKEKAFSLDLQTELQTDISQQPFWQEIAGKTQALAMMLIKVLLHSIESIMLSVMMAP